MLKRKRMTQIFPCLLKARRAQRKLWFYTKMRFDGNRYAETRAEAPLPACVFDSKTVLLNTGTGFDIQFQMNKVYNLGIAARPVNGILIRPGETFSFWRLVRGAERQANYRDGLVLENGKLVTAPGGGLCLLSNFLYWLFIHTPLDIVERHAHQVKGFPSQDFSHPDGVDATVSEGWLDLKARNQTDATFQIELNIDDTHLHGRILADRALPYRYDIANRDMHFFRRGGSVYERVSVLQTALDAGTGQTVSEKLLATDVFEIGYPLPDGTPIVSEEGAAV